MPACHVMSCHVMSCHVMSCHRQVCHASMSMTTYYEGSPHLCYHCPLCRHHAEHHVDRSSCHKGLRVPAFLSQGWQWMRNGGNAHFSSTLWPPSILTCTYQHLYLHAVPTCVCEAFWVAFRRHLRGISQVRQNDMESTGSIKVRCWQALTLISTFSMRRMSWSSIGILM